MSKLLDQSVNDGVAQLLNSPNQWAIDMWRDGNANHWNPLEVDMSTDIKQWTSNHLTEDEKLLVKRTLGLFSAGESLVSHSIASVERIFITDGCCRQYLARKDFEESLHNMTVNVCCAAYSLNVEEVSEAYKNIPAVRKKIKYLKSVLDSFGPNFDIKNVEGIQLFVKNMIIVYLLMEGTWFFNSFATIMALCRQNKLPGLYDQIKFTLKDEDLHVKFGIKVINQLKEEYPKFWTKSFQESIVQLFNEGLMLEIEYSREVVPNGILGLSSDMMMQYASYLANLRLSAIGLPEPYPGVKNPFGWLVETQDLPGMSAFFERREKEYQHSCNLEDDL